MNQGILPSTGFPVEDPSPLITLNEEETYWNQNVFYSSFDVSDELEPLPFIDIEISQAEDAYGNEMVEFYQEDWFSILLNNYLSISYNEEEEVLIYPNPTENILYIELGQRDTYSSSSTVQIYDMTGKRIFQDVIPSTGNSLKIETSEWRNGLFRVVVSGDNGVWTEMINVQH